MTEPTTSRSAEKDASGRRWAGRLARLRRRASGTAVLGLALGVVGIGYAALAPSSDAGEPSADVVRGQQLYQNACIACHGANLQGVQGRGPSLLGVGQAAVYFQVATGRMPLARQEAQANEKPPKYTEEEVNQIAAYVQSIGGGPRLPVGDNLRGGDLGEGGELFRLNCAQCHNFAGRGGAVPEGIVIWVAGIGALMFMVLWIGAKS